jgi:phosphate acetyltransferase
VISTFFHILKTNRKEGIASSFFLMQSPNAQLGENGFFLFSDCAVNIDPSPKKLARIAYQMGNLARDIFGFSPRVAILSYSTKGSGSGVQVDLIRETGEELQKLNPDFPFETEMQLDAAIHPGVSNRKAPGNSLEGRANVFIFPDLQSGNIGYKLAERVGGCQAYGPVMVGLQNVASDLSRGCSSEDIVGTFIVSAFYQLKKKSI